MVSNPLKGLAQRSLNPIKRVNYNCIDTGIKYHTMRTADLKPMLRQAGAHAYQFFVLEAWGLDWLVAAALITINYTLPGSRFIPPVERHYDEGDPTLSYPSVKLELGEVTKFTSMFVIPAVVGAVVQIWKRSWLDW